MNNLDTIKNPYKYLQKVLKGSGMHVHHITPRSLGGTDTWDNLSILSLDDHKLLHAEIAQDNPENSSLMFAANFMQISKDEDHYLFSRSLAGKIGGPASMARNVEKNPDHQSKAGKIGVQKSMITRRTRKNAGVLTQGEKEQWSTCTQKAIRKVKSTLDGHVTSWNWVSRINKIKPQYIGTWIDL